MTMKRVLHAVLMFALSLSLALGVWGGMPAGKVAAATCTWTGAVDTSWVNSGNWTDCDGGTPGTSDTAIIPDVSAGSGNHPVVTAALTVGTITIQNGGILEYSAASGVTFSITTFNIEDGGKYIHNRAAATPLSAMGRNFASNSTVEIQNFNTPSSLPVFGNLIINSSATVQMSGYLATVQGNLVKQNSGELRLGTTQMLFLAVGGDLDIQGGIVTIQSGTATNDATITVGGNVVVASGATFRSGTNATGVHTISVGGHWANNGTFTSNSNANTVVVFTGTIQQTIGGSSVTAFNNLTVISGTTVVIPSTNIPTVASTMVNSGTLQQTQTVSDATVSFLTISTDKYRGVDIQTPNNLGVVTVTVQGNANACTNDPTSPAYIKRCFSITPTNNATATLTLWATDAEMNGIDFLSGDEGALYRYVTNQWIEQTRVEFGTATGGYNYVMADVDGFSNFLLGESGATPTAVTYAGLQSGAALWTPVSLLFLGGAALVLRKRR